MPAHDAASSPARKRGPSVFRVAWAIAFAFACTLAIAQEASFIKPGDERDCSRHMITEKARKLDADSASVIP